MKPPIAWQLSFLRGYLTGNAATAPPIALVVDVTQRCNLRCLHCRRHSPLSDATAHEDSILDFSLDRFHELCREAAQMGVAKIVLIGEGEPLLHPDIGEMVRSASAAGCRVVLLTNGTLLEPHHVSEFSAAGLDELRVSLWAADEEEYAAQYPGTAVRFFQQAIDGVRSFAAERNARGERRPRIVLHRPIEPRFFRRLERTLDIAGETGCDAVSLSPMKPLLQEDMDRLLSADEERELIPILREIGRTAERRGLAHNTDEVVQRLRIGRAVWETLPCYIGWVDLRVRVNGDVFPCDTCSWPLGNVYHDSLYTIWNSPALMAFRRAGRRRDGIADSGRACRCDFCCHAITNQQLHRRLRLLAPIVPAARGAGP
jgi:radical SAM protein with 4Fe4S-binding SPASM domain